MATIEEQVEWWTKQAAHDLESARSSRQSGFHDTCALLCQQSAEKYLKALYMKRHAATPPKIHECDRLATSLSAPSKVLDAAGVVENDYLESRYPDVAGGVPHEQFTDADSQERVQAAEEVQQWVLQQLAPTP